MVLPVNLRSVPLNSFKRLIASSMSFLLSVLLADSNFSMTAEILFLSIRRTVLFLFPHIINVGNLIYFLFRIISVH